jgi:hypothetical protein
MPPSRAEQDRRPPGRKDGPLYRVRRLLTKAHERLDERGDTKLHGLLEAGDPRREVRMAWHAKEVTRSIHEITDPPLVANSSTNTDKTPRRVMSARDALTRSHPHVLA